MSHPSALEDRSANHERALETQALSPIQSPEPHEIRDFLGKKFGIPGDVADAAIKCATKQVDLFTAIDMRQVLKDCDEVILMREAA